MWEFLRAHIKTVVGWRLENRGGERCKKYLADRPIRLWIWCDGREREKEQSRITVVHMLFGLMDAC